MLSLLRTGVFPLNHIKGKNKMKDSDRVEEKEIDRGLIFVTNLSRKILTGGKDNIQHMPLDVMGTLTGCRINDFDKVYSKKVTTVSQCLPVRPMYMRFSVEEGHTFCAPSDDRVCTLAPV